jgi:hypothetical protein
MIACVSSINSRHGLLTRVLLLPRSVLGDALHITSIALELLELLKQASFDTARADLQGIKDVDLSALQPYSILASASITADVTFAYCIEFVPPLAQHRKAIVEVWRKSNTPFLDVLGEVWRRAEYWRVDEGYAARMRLADPVDVSFVVRCV